MAREGGSEGSVSITGLTGGGAMSTEFNASRLPQYNSVKSATAENPASEENQSYEEEVEERALECVENFMEEYPHLVGLPLSEKPGRPLRKELVEEEYREEYVEPETEWGQGFSVERLDRAEPVTWGEALFRFLVNRQPYDDGVAGRFRDTETDETFTKEFQDCWTTDYGEEQAARNSGAERQLMGGAYPENEKSGRSGEVEEGEWSGETATIMLTRTGSSIPEGERLAPIDHADQVVRTWSQGGVYDTVRNICEYELDLDSEQWGYVRGDDVHGMGPFERENPGENACYPHSHDAIYIDLGATDVMDEFEYDWEIRAVLEDKFYKAIEKHVEACEIAEPEAHTKEDAIEVRLDLEHPAGYATEYLRLDENEMMEMPVEFQAFAAVEWATNRQRIARSQVFTEAAKADFCKQDSEVEHGERLKYDRGGHGDPEVVCAHCGSGVGIDSETIVEHRVADGFEWLSPWSRKECREAAVDGGVGVEEPGECDVVVRARIGEGTGSARIRQRVEEYVTTHGRSECPAVVMGELGIAPQYRSVVEEVLAGEDSSTEVETVTGPPEPPDAGYELEAVVMPDGGEEEVTSPGGGGVDMVELMLPETRLLLETRLQYVGERGRPKIIVENNGERLATHNPETAAAWLVDNGCRRPWHAEVAMTFTNHGKGVAREFEEPEVRPPR